MVVKSFSKSYYFKLLHHLRITLCQLLTLGYSILLKIVYPKETAGLRWKVVFIEYAV